MYLTGFMIYLVSDSVAFSLQCTDQHGDDGGCGRDYAVEQAFPAALLPALSLRAPG
jgi:hypothetical protein